VFIDLPFDEAVPVLKCRMPTLATAGVRVEDRAGV
jgi:hypothetical protein